eukprot:COSAG05_NODE_1081_length_5940_cov_4.264852_9_plen_150_part_00
MDLPTFLTMVARKLGADSMFVLAYSVIQLNTDAHNPRLKGERMSKSEFVQVRSIYRILDYFKACICARLFRRRFSVCARVCVAVFVQNNRRSPDLLVLSEVIMASLYDEIHANEIKLKTAATGIHTSTSYSAILAHHARCALAIYICDF